MRHGIQLLLLSISLGLGNRLHGMATGKPASLKQIVTQQILMRYPELLADAQNMGAISRELNWQSCQTIVGSIQQRFPLTSVTPKAIYALALELRIDHLKACPAWQAKKQAYIDPRHPRIEQLQALSWYSPVLFTPERTVDERRAFLADRARRLEVYFRSRGIDKPYDCLQSRQD